MAKKAKAKKAKIKYVKGAIRHGSEEHAALLELMEATEEDDLQYEGWTLADPTKWGENATEEYLRRILRQKVRELNTPPIPPSEMQSKDLRAPNYAPPLWTPG